MTREEIWNKAYKRLLELYGKNPELKIVNRFLSEKAALSHFGVAEYFDQLGAIRREARGFGEILVAKAPVSSCLTAFLLGASEINPLEEGIPFETYLPYAERLKTKDTVPENSSDLYGALMNSHFQPSVHRAAQACHNLAEATGVSAAEIDTNKIKYCLLVGGDFSCAPSKLAAFMAQAFETVQPSDYEGIKKLIGMAHGTGCWHRNAERLLLGGVCELRDLPSTRDEIFLQVSDSLRANGLHETGFAIEVSEKTRRGEYAQRGLDAATEDMLTRLGFDEWYVSYILRVRYMCPSALVALKWKYIVFLTFYKTYFPKLFTRITGESVW